MGTYTVSVEAANAIGTGRLNRTGYITVSAPVPFASFTGTPTTGTAPLAVQFTDSSMGSHEKWSWNFGDGGSSTARNPSHVYSSAGTYSVQLTAANAMRNDTVTKEGFVVVTEQYPQFTYSVTYIEEYPGNRSLYPYGNNALATVNYYLGSTEGWSRVFAKGNSEVTNEDLGTQGGGLNGATFHYHFSHGGRLLEGGNTVLELSNDTFVYPQDVQNKWGGNNKWVYIDACLILDDTTWGDALNTTHGILGYKSEIGSKSTVWTVRDFFDNAIYSNKTILSSFKNASCYGVEYSEFKNVTGAAIFHNLQQANGDHLPGHGTIEPDAEPSDIPGRTIWEC